MSNEHTTEEVEPVITTRPALENRPTLEGRDRVEELHGQLADLVGHHDVEAVTALMAELHGLGDPGAAVWLEARKLGAPTEEKVTICPEVAVTTTYLSDVAKATDKMRAVLADLEEAVALAGAVHADRHAVWNADTPDGVGEAFDDRTGWSDLEALLGQVHAFAAVFHDDGQVPLPMWADGAPGWYLDLLRDDHDRKVKRATSPAWAEVSFAEEELDEAAAALRHFGLEV